MLRQVLSVFGALVLVLSGCGGSGTSAPEPSLHVSAVFRSASVGPSAQCPAGGIEVQSGIDQNGNGALDANEVQSTQLVCNGAAGADGLSSLVRLTAEGAGAHCAAGGLRVDTGLDVDRNGVLSDAEVTATNYVCSGVTASSQVPVAAPLVLAPSPPPFGDTVREATFTGVLGVGDVLLADGTRADFLAVTVDAAGALVVDGDMSGGRAAAYLFTNGCIAEPDISRWGPCALGALGTIRVESGQYILLVKQVASALPWEEIAYGSRARLYVGAGTAAGTIDPTYGAAGLASFLATSDTTLWTRDVQISLDSQGRVLAGWQDESVNNVAHVARLTTEGQLDTGFAGTGIAAHTFAADPLDYAWTSRPVESTGGKVLAAVTRSYIPFVMRFLPSGVLDMTFGVGGIADLPTDIEWAHAISSLSDGSVLVAASVNAPGTSSGQRQLSVLKLDSEGKLDPGFGAAGRMDVRVAYNSWTWGIQTTGDGAVIAFGSASDDANTATRGFVVRLSTNGLPDANFGVGGVSILTSEVKAVRPLAGGRLLVGAVAPVPTGPTTYKDQAMTHRLTPAGTIDLAYGNQGSLVASVPENAPVGLDFDLMNRLLVVAGTKTGVGPATNWKLFRFLDTGERDPSFGTQGSVPLDLTTVGDPPSVTALAPNGAIYVAGSNGNAQTVQVQKVK